MVMPRMGRRGELEDPKGSVPVWLVGFMFLVVPVEHSEIIC